MSVMLNTFDKKCCVLNAASILALCTFASVSVNPVSAENVVNNVSPNSCYTIQQVNEGEQTFSIKDGDETLYYRVEMKPVSADKPYTYTTENVTQANSTFTIPAEM